jgi:hypothetical protein
MIFGACILSCPPLDIYRKTQFHFTGGENLDSRLYL